MENKIGFYEVKPGEKSYGRLNIAWYFWSICLPGSLWLLYVLGTGILAETFSVSDGMSLVSAFIILQLGWIAPKQMSKFYESIKAKKEDK